jgi:hypothetical protein
MMAILGVLVLCAQASSSTAQGLQTDGLSVEEADSLRSVTPGPRVTHRLRYGVIGAVVGTGAGAGVAYLATYPHVTDMDGLVYMLGMGVGFVLGTIVGVSVGSIPDVEPIKASLSPEWSHPHDDEHALHIGLTWHFAGAPPPNKARS